APGRADGQPVTGGSGDGGDRSGDAGLPAASRAGAAPLPADQGGTGTAQAGSAGERALRLPDQGVSAEAPAEGLATVSADGAVVVDRRDAPVGPEQFRPQRRQDGRARRIAAGTGLGAAAAGRRPEHGKPADPRRAAGLPQGATRADRAARRG